MKNLVKITSLILALLMTVAIFASCGDTAGGNTETSAAVQSETAPAEADTTEADNTPVYPDANYNGADFTVYERIDSTYCAENIYAEEENGDVMNDSTLKRNNMLTSKYNVVIKVKDEKNPYNTVKADIAGGTVEYDVLLDRRSSLAGLVTSGLLMDIKSIGFDYEQSWWDSNATRDYEIAGKVYFFVNDVSTANLSGTRFLYFNKQIVEDFHLTNPYDYVANNTWTLENFVAMVKGVSDVAADGSLGTYGMLLEEGETNGNYMHLFTAAGIKLCTNVDGELVCNISDNVDKLQAITDLLKEAFVNKTYGLTYDDTQAICTDVTGFSSKWTLGRGMFAAGHFLFVQNGMGVSYQFNEMTDDYGVLPNPKYNTDQESYYHKVDKYSIIWAVPNAESVDKDRLVNVMNYWSYLSSDTVMPAFYDITIRSKRVSEATASENLDIIKNSVNYELADLFCATIMTCVNQGYKSGSMATALKQYTRSIETTLKATSKLLTE